MAHSLNMNTGHEEMNHCRSSKICAGVTVFVGIDYLVDLIPCTLQKRVVCVTHVTDL